MSVDLLWLMPVQPLGEKNRKGTLGNGRLAATLPGMPLIYGGQESGLDKRMQFFEKDPIAWKDYRYAPFYAELLKLKHDNPALWNGQYGGALQVLDTGNDKVFAFRRHLDYNVVQVVVNVSNAAQRYTLPGAPEQTLGAWEYGIGKQTR